MPKPGFKSITIAETIWSRWYRRWIRSGNKKPGISFSKWITEKILYVLQVDKVKFRFEFIVFTTELVVIRDNWTNDMVHIERRDRGTWCKFCKQEYCIHTGFLWSDYRMYDK